MVIQRWQSVLLLVCSVMMACFTFMSLGQVQLEQFSLDFTTLGFSIEGISTNGAPSGYEVRTWSFFVVSLVSFILPLINIFLFKNLTLQGKICLIEVLFLVSVAAIGFYFGYFTFEGNHVSWSSIIITPLLALVADIMAYKCIRKDYNRLRSVDRFR